MQDLKIKNALLSALDFGESGAADVQTGKLELSRKLLLRPSASVPQPPNLRAYDICGASSRSRYAGTHCKGSTSPQLVCVELAVIWDEAGLFDASSQANYLSQSMPQTNRSPVSQEEIELSSSHSFRFLADLLRRHPFATVANRRDRKVIAWLHH